jgi:surfeit locus 1 family protein
VSRPPVRARGKKAGQPAPSRRARGLLLALCALFTVVFAGLGVWQVQRLFWKLDLIARVEARLAAEPAEAPAPAAFTVDDEYRRVALKGQFLNDRETLVQAVTELGGGFWVMTPFVTTRGFIVLVNRGFVPPEGRAPESRAAGQIEGEAGLVGLVRLSEPGGGFLRSNDPAHERWFSRDVAAIGAARGLEQLVSVAPYFVDADATPVPGGSPVGGLTVVRFSNNHLVYALTWFALALMCVGAGVMVWRRG